MGFCLLALLYLAVPHWLKRWENTLKGIVPLCGAAGTLAFATAPLQSAVPPLALGLAGLAVSGLGYFWFASRCFTLMARARSIMAIAWAIVAAVLLKTFLLPVATDLLDSEAQVVFACAIPILSSLLLWIAQLSLGVTGSIQSRTPHARGKALPSGPAQLHTAAHSQRLPSCHRASTQLLGNMGQRPQRFPLRPYGAFRSWP